MGANGGAKRSEHTRVELHKFGEKAAWHDRAASITTPLPSQKPRTLKRSLATSTRVEPRYRSDDLDVHGARNSPAHRIAHRGVILRPFDDLAKLLGGHAVRANTNRDAHAERTWKLGAC